MKKTLIILFATMAVVIGALAYFACPQIKAEWEKRFGADAQTTTPQPTQWMVDEKIAETDAEKTFIAMFNDFAGHLQRISEKADKGEKLSLDDEWQINAFGEKMGQFYEQNQYSIRPSVAFAAMDKIAEIIGHEKPSEVWAHPDQRRQQREQETLEKIARAEAEYFAEMQAQSESNNGDVQQHTPNASASLPGNNTSAVQPTNQETEQNTRVRARFPENGRTARSESPAEINNTQSIGRVTVSVGMSGRLVVGNTPIPKCENGVGGSIVIEVAIDPAGNVTNTAYQAQGSTITNNTLLNSALSCARRTRFNAVSDAPAMQKGTITYVFVSSTVDAQAQPVIQAKNIQLIAFDANDREVTKARRAARLRVDFCLPASNAITAGDREISARIIGPQGLLANSPNASVVVDGETLSCTTSRMIYYSNDELPISLYCGQQIITFVGDDRLDKNNAAGLYRDS